jgi:hypothetical protein
MDRIKAIEARNEAIKKLLILGIANTEMYLRRPVINNSNGQ